MAAKVRSRRDGSAVPLDATDARLLVRFETVRRNWGGVERVHVVLELESVEELTSGPPPVVQEQLLFLLVQLEVGGANVVGVHRQRAHPGRGGDEALVPCLLDGGKLFGPSACRGIGAGSS
jgi:hypothetical protein